MSQAITAEVKQILAQLSVPVLLLDDQGKIIFQNTSFDASSSLVNKNLLSCLAPSFHQEFKGFLSQLHTQQKPAVCECLEGDLFSSQTLQIYKRLTLKAISAGKLILAELDYPDTPDYLKDTLEQSRVTIKAIWDNAFVGVLTISADYRIQSLNKMVENLFEYPEEELINRNINFIIPDFVEVHDNNRLTDQLSDEEKMAIGFGNEVAGIRADGEQLVLELNIASVQKGSGDADYLVILQDISDRKTAEAELYEEKARTHLTLESIHDGVVTTNIYGEIDYVNPVGEKLSGWLTEELVGENFSEMFRFISEESQTELNNIIQQCIQNKEELHFDEDTILIARDNQFETPVSLSVSPQRNLDNEVIGCVVIIRDVSTTRKLAAEINWQASHDALTGLVNRREFERRLGDLLIDAKQGDETHVVCFLDLDQFKIVNDTCGHAAGDELLRQLTNALNEKMRRSDILARLGGDEFGVILPHCSAERGERIANSWREIVQNYRFNWEGSSFSVGVSIGLVPVDKYSTSTETVMAAADTACYVAKESGRNRVHVFREDDSELAMKKGEMQWASRIEDAIKNNDFVLFYQPITPISKGKGLAEHIEILLRMKDADGSIIPPGAFIPSAERYQLMGRLDRWVVSNTLKWMGANPDKLGDTVVGINLSGNSMADDGLLAFVMEEILKNAIFPSQICFEITETAAIANLSKATRFINQLKDFGCYFALDDFGSGLSSFAYLKSMKVDYLKIDGSFVKDMITDKVDYAMVSSINQVGHVVGLKTIAEFVEDDEILKALKKLGVDYAQGYGIQKPEAIDSFSLE